MGTLNAVLELIGRTLGEWNTPRRDIAFTSRNAALLVVAGFRCWRPDADLESAAWRDPGRTSIAVPAMLHACINRHWRSSGTPRSCCFSPVFRSSAWRLRIHTSLSAKQVSYPGRRIEVIIDASLSMLSPFTGQQLKTQSDTAFSPTWLPPNISSARG
jgi:hypothetical protein